jgi:hypothetical protein
VPELSEVKPKFGKGPSRKTLKGRKHRAESVQIKLVRNACVLRDGHCRMGRDVPFHVCIGPSEWAHIGEYKRFKTRGQAPERRHTTAGSMMLCRAAHREYDAGRLAIECPCGCDGQVTFWTKR